MSTDSLFGDEQELLFSVPSVVLCATFGSDVR